MSSDNQTGKLSGKVAFITGGGRGIGREIALKFAGEGADLFLCATRMETLEETKSLADGTGARVELYVGDVSERDQVEAMVKTAIEEKFGRIDILVNNAGIHRGAMGRILKPQEISPLAVYLASDDSSGMTGQSILLDGGMVFV